MSNIVQQAMQFTGNFTDYCLTTIVSIDSNVIPPNIYNNFLCSIECSADKVYKFEEKIKEFKRPLPILSFSTKTEKRKEYPKLLSVLQEKLCKILTPVIEKGKYVQLKAIMPTEEKATVYSYDDIKKLFPLLVHETPYELEVQVSLVSLFLNSIGNSKLVHNITDIDDFKNSYITHISEYKKGAYLKNIKDTIITSAGVETTLQQIGQCINDYYKAKLLN